MEAVAPRPSYLAISRFFLWVGASSWGGLYAVLPRIKSEMSGRGWVPLAEFDTIMAAATLVPGPSFVSLAGLLGHRMRGALGSLVAMLSLMLPPTVLVAGALIFLPPTVLTGPLAPVVRMVTIAMAGVMFGNAWKILKAERLRWTGVLLLVASFAAILAGISVVSVVIVALLLGRWLLGGESR